MTPAPNTIPKYSQPINWCPHCENEELIDEEDNYCQTCLIQISNGEEGNNELKVFDWINNECWTPRNRLKDRKYFLPINWCPCCEKEELIDEEDSYCQTCLIRVSNGEEGDSSYLVNDNIHNECWKPRKKM
tara:strand:- start:192 stop:584 length:393 start_codon:yes stop_codon:yes gene_type:complete